MHLPPKVPPELAAFLLKYAVAGIGHSVTESSPDPVGIEHTVAVASFFKPNIVQAKALFA